MSKARPAASVDPDSPHAADAPSDGARLLRLEAFLPYRLSVLSNRISNAIARAYRDRFALTTPQWRVMAVLAEESGLTATALTARTQMDKVAVSRAVANLVGRGLIGKTPADDARAHLLALSKAGREAYFEIAPMAEAFERRLLASLSAEERAALDRLLARLDAASQDL